MKQAVQDMIKMQSQMLHVFLSVTTLLSKFCNKRNNLIQNLDTVLETNTTQLETEGHLLIHWGRKNLN